MQPVNRSGWAEDYCIKLRAARKSVRSTQATAINHHDVAFLPTGHTERARVAGACGRPQFLQFINRQTAFQRKNLGAWGLQMRGERQNHRQTAYCLTDDRVGQYFGIPVFDPRLHNLNIRQLELNAILLLKARPARAGFNQRNLTIRPENGEHQARQSRTTAQICH